MTFAGNIALIFLCVLDGINNGGDLYFVTIREAGWKYNEGRQS